MSSPRSVLIRQRSSGVVPAQFAHLGGEQRTVVQAEMLADVAAVLEDLGAVGELLRRHEVELFEQRDVAVRVVVALDPGKAIPVPHAAEVAGHLDDADALDTGLLQIRPGQQSGEAAAEDDDFGVFDDRVAFRDRRVGVDLVEICEIVLELQVLRLRLPAAVAWRARAAYFSRSRVDVDVVRCIGGPAGVLGGGQGLRSPTVRGVRRCPCTWTAGCGG